MRRNRRLKEAVAFPLLLGLGLLQMAGALLQIPLVSGLGAATNASPHPKVFSAVYGLETFSTRFFLEWTDHGGKAHSLEVTPAQYRKIPGPYNRRNVYGAALAYGPVLATDARTRPMFEQVLDYALSGRAPLLRELGIDPAKVRYPMTVRLEVEPGTRLARPMPLHFEVGDE